MSRKYIREGVGEEIEDFLEKFLERDKGYYMQSDNGYIEAWRLEDNIVTLKLKVKLGN